MTGVRETCRRGKEVVSWLQSRWLNFGYSLTHSLTTVWKPWVLLVWSSLLAGGPCVPHELIIRPNYTLLNMYSYTVLYCARETYP